MTTTQHTMTRSSGFTLVELAVVMTIIGLLIGGILKGQELVENSRVQSLISQMKSYEGAFNTFRDKYHAFPGDMPNAIGNLAGCIDNTICLNGDGNEEVGTPLATFDEVFTSDWSTESGQSWNHLFLANLVKGVNSSNISPTFGVTNPKADVGGGFLMNTVNQDELTLGTEVSDGTTGVYVLLRNTPDGTTPCSGATPICLLTPTRAAMVDRKIDDGFAIKGMFRAYSAGAYTGGSGGCGFVAPNGAGGYNETITEKRCDAAYQIGQ